MKLPGAKFLRGVSTEAALLLIGIPVFLWTMIPIYHMFLFAISPKEDAFSGKLWPDHPTLHNFDIVFGQKHYFLAISGPVLEFDGDLLRRRRADAVHRHRRGIRDQPAEMQGGRR